MLETALYGDEGSIVLLVITVLLLWKIIFNILDSRGIVVGIPQLFHSFFESKRGRRLKKKIKFVAYIATTIGIVTYLAVDVFPQQTTNLQSFFGMLVMILVCFIASAKPSKVNWHPVFWSFAIQFGLAYFTLKTQIGYDVFKWLGDLIHALLKFSDAGSSFVVGKSFQTWGLALAEAPLLIRPYLPTVTKSELHTIMTCGFASISGGMMALFISLGAPANHLLTAAVISALAALAISKLMYPETETICLKTQSSLRIVDKTEATNSLSAFSDGAMMAVTVCAAVWSNTLAFDFIQRDLNPEPSSWSLSIAQ